MNSFPLGKPADVRAWQSPLRTLLLVLGLSIWIGAPQRGSTSELAPGSGTFTYKDDILSELSMRVYYQAPQTIDADTAIWFVIHGQGRNANGYFDSWKREAEKRNVLLLVPEFTEAAFPGSDSYNLANIVKGKRSPQDQERWTYALVERIFDHVKAELGLHAEHYFIYGHSAGSQFSHRMLLLMDHTRAAGAIFANAGWYTMPTHDIAFPYGIGGMNLSDENLASFFQRRILLLLGADDTDEKDSQLRTSKEAMKQGAHRVARGETFYSIATQEAARLGVPLNWELVMAPGVAHSNKGLVSTAAQAFQDMGEELKQKH